MRAVRLIILAVLVLASLALLLYAGSRTFTISYLNRLEAGESGVVRQMLACDMAAALEKYHLSEVEAARIKLPPAPHYTPTPKHPDAERFFYADAHGNVTIKGISNKNVPRDHLSQKCIFFCDYRLPWSKARLLFEAFMAEKITYVYLAGITAEGKLSYVQLEICAGGTFRIYPYMICLLNDHEAFYYNENEDASVAIGHVRIPISKSPDRQTSTKNLESFKMAANKIHDDSPIRNPFVRLLAGDDVSAGAVYERLVMFLPAEIQPISVISRTDARPQILESVEEFARKQREGGGK